MKNAIPAAERVGQRFGRLVVVEVLPKGRILCQCDCGIIKNIQCSHVFWGGTLSCGCLLKEYRCTHRMSNRPEYRAWARIKERCYNQNSQDYKNYGARGIRMHPEWEKSFESFYSYIKERPSPKHSLDRFPDNDGNYEPGNLRWATKKQQADNRRTSNWLDYNGRRMVITDWARELNVTDGAIRKHLKTTDFSTIVKYFKAVRYKRCGTFKAFINKLLKQQSKK